MPELMALTCPVCGAPLSPGDAHCAFCGSAIFIKADAPELSLPTLNQSVIQEHIADFRARIRKDAYDVEAHYGLGMAYYSLGLPEEATEELTRAAKLMPENADIQTQLAVVLHQAVLAGNTAAEGPMRERLAKALTLDPANFEANLLRADVMQRRGDYVGALRVLRPVVARDPERGNAKRAEILSLLGRQALHDGDTDGFAQVIAELRESGEEARARDLVMLSLQQHRDELGPAVIVAPGGGSATMTEDLGDRVVSIGKTILVGIGAFIAGFVLLVVVTALLPTDAEGSMTGGSLAAFGIAFLAWLASPFVAGVLYRRRVRKHTVAWDTRQGTRLTRDDVLTGRASIDDLIATERMVTAAATSGLGSPTAAATANVPARQGAHAGAAGTPLPASSPGARQTRWFDGNR
ncbi:MAG TPA: tetratricopeptide repeat protein [Thermomicrobiales bacterium]|nr:tetratricopeptide repeat protein [Thermomicrobiales bacterium]